MKFRLPSSPMSSIGAQLLKAVDWSITGLVYFSGIPRSDVLDMLKGIAPIRGLNQWVKARLLIIQNNQIEKAYGIAACNRGIKYSVDEALREISRRAKKRPINHERPVVYWVGANLNQDNSGFLASLQRHANVFCFKNSQNEYGPLYKNEGATSDLYDPGIVRDNSLALLRGYEQCKTELGKPDLLLGQMWANFLSVDSLKVIRDMGTLTANISMDDRLPEHWGSVAGIRLGSVGLVDGLDLVLTTTPESCLRYAVEGCPALFGPLGSDPELFEDRPENERIHDVTFVGNKYGVRESVITALLNAGIHVDAYGHGWKNGSLSPDKAAPLFSRSKIVLGIGAIGHNEDRFTLKLRDFDAPMSGALYVTHRNPDLLRFYDEDREIVCYRTSDECVRKIKFHLANTAHRVRVAGAGADKCRKLYTWDRWIVDLFRILNLPTQELAVKTNG